MRRTAVYGALLALLWTTMPVPTAHAVSASTAFQPAPTGVYIVLVAGEPVVTYDGGVPGLAATHPADGSRLDVRSAAVRDYQDHLRKGHRAALAAAGLEAAALVYDYTVALNGFAVRLTAREAGALAEHPDVVSVRRDEVRTVATDSSPDFLGLTDPRGPWATGYTGDGVVIGFVDTGIWPEHPSFGDAARYGAAPAHFTGTSCEFGDAVPGASGFNGLDTAFPCNGKVVGAAAFGAGLLSGSPADLAAGEFLSARDANGHGTHVAGIAAGNAGVVADLDGLAATPLSGIAPTARVAAYKACWSVGEHHGQCAVSDIVAAIDQAVADGVDVLNVSAGSASDGVAADDLALLFAGAAGVMVSAAAGNAGPGTTATVVAPGAAPWVTAVAAGTQWRAFGAPATLGDGRVVEGVATGDETSALPLIDAGALANPQCEPLLGFAESVAGAAVLCPDARDAVRAAETVAANGGAAVVLVSEGAVVVASPARGVATITVDASSGQVLADYVEEVGATATLSIGAATPGNGTGSVLAPFSSRGPSPLHGDVLKPDVVAPGVSIVAATSPASLTGSAGRDFATMSGTSMASAHVAGVFALLRQAHPAWTADVARSALITTTRRDVWMPDGSSAAGGLDMGAGYIQPGGATNRRGSLFNPGLVLTTTAEDFRAFLCGIGERLPCSGPPIAARDLNSPAIALADLTGSVTVRRTVTSVADKLRVFDARIDAPPGFAVEVTPRTISLHPGETATFEVTITTTRAPAGEWRHGAITWASDSYRVAMPVVVSASVLDVSSSASGSGAGGRADIDVTFGYTGAYTATASPLVTPTVIEGTVEQDPLHEVGTALRTGDGVSSHPIELPPATALLRVALEPTAGATDLDLYVVDDGGDVVAASSSASAGEVIDLAAPAAGAYRIVVHGRDTGSAPADYELSIWTVGTEGVDALDVVAVPRSAEQGSTGIVTVRWSNLEPDATYVGLVSHADDVGVLDRTVVTIGPEDASRPRQLVQGTRRPRLNVR